MLKHIPAVLPPDLVKYMMEMGHGDTLVLADAHFPAAACGQRVVQCCGIPALTLLDAVLELLPLDTYVETPVVLMETVPGEKLQNPPIWQQYKQRLAVREPEAAVGFLERFAYYEAAKKAYVIVQTGETAQYANLLLQKGIVR